MAGGYRARACVSTAPMRRGARYACGMSKPAATGITEAIYNAAGDRIARGEAMEMDAAIRDVYEQSGGTVAVYDAGTKRWRHDFAAHGIRGWVD